MPRARQHRLFDPESVADHLERPDLEYPDDVDEIRETLERWGGAATVEERNPQRSFVEDVFSTVLGYEPPRGGEETFHLLPAGTPTGVTRSPTSCSDSSNGPRTAN